MRALDKDAAELPWRDGYLEVRSGERHVLNAPVFAEPGMCVLVYAYSYDESPPAFDLYARVHYETVSLDYRDGRSALVVYRVPADP